MKKLGEFIFYSTVPYAVLYCIGMGVSKLIRSL